MARNTINNDVAMAGGADGSPRARRYRVVIAYDGTAYSGWQYQENAVGIQQVVEDVLASLDGAPVRVFGSSRTDAGVHAKGFVGHFHLTKPIPPKNLVRAMNARLPDAIRVLKAAYAKEDFDARLSAKGKEYRYQLYQADIMPPHLAPYWTFCHRPLDLAAMQEAAERHVKRAANSTRYVTSERGGCPVPSMPQRWNRAERRTCRFPGLPI